MNISLFGTGNMARGIGTRLVAGSHSVTLFGRNPAKVQALAEELRKTKSGASVSTAKIGDPVFDEVVVLALYYGANVEVAKQYAAQFAGKTVVDISNPLNASYDGLTTAPDTSAGEQVQAAAPQARVVKAFNTTFAGTLATGEVAGQPLDVLIAGDDGAAKKTVARLVTDGGLVAVDAGPLMRSRQLEGLALLGISLQGLHQLNFASAWKLVH